MPAGDSARGAQADDGTSLYGLRVALSISTPPGLAQRGSSEVEFAALAVAIVGAVIEAGATIVYCPRLPIAGLARAIIGEACRNEDGRDVIDLVIPEIQYRECPRRDLERLDADLRPAGAVTLVSSHGRAFGVSDPRPVEAETTAASGLTALRTHVAHVTDARIAIGGKPSEDPSRESGVGEECRLTAEVGGLVVPIAGFGGAADQVSCHCIDSELAQVLATSRDADLLARSVVRAIGSL